MRTSLWFKMGSGEGWGPAVGVPLVGVSRITKSDRLAFLLSCLHCLPLKHDLVGQPQEVWVEGMKSHLSVGVMEDPQEFP